MKSRNSSPPRDTILLNIDTFWKRPYEVSPTHFTNDSYTLFNTKFHAGIIYKTWKLLTGDPGNEQFNDNPYPMSNPFPTVQLYKYLSDPGERINLANRYPQVVEKLLGKLAEFHKNSVPFQKLAFDKVCQHG